MYGVHHMYGLCFSVAYPLQKEASTTNIKIVDKALLWEMRTENSQAETPHTTDTGEGWARDENTKVGFLVEKTQEIPEP